MPVTWTQDDVDRLKAVIATGAKSVNYEGPPGRSFVAHSMSEMLELLGQMQRSVDSASGVSSYKLIATRKGFGR
jgi:hypothetical protein